MKEIMTSIFKAHNFRVDNLSNNQNINSFCAISEDPQKINYYAVLFIENLFDIEEKEVNFNAFYEDIKRTITNYDHRMDKNLSMVICSRLENLKVTEDINKKIYQIEED